MSGAQKVVPMLAVMYERLPLPTARPAYDMPLLAGSRLKDGPTSGAPWQTCNCGGAPVGVVPGGPVVPIVGGPSNDGFGTQRAAACDCVDPASGGPVTLPESSGGADDPPSHWHHGDLHRGRRLELGGNAVTSTE